MSLAGDTSFAWASKRPVSELICYTVVPVILILYLTQIAYYLFFHPLRNVPGPFLARFSKDWRTLRYFRGTWMEDVIELHTRYGPVVRITPNEVSFVDETALKELYGVGKPNQKTSWYKTWEPPDLGVESFFAVRDQRVHRHLRSRVSGAYTMSSILSYESLIQEVLDTNWNKFREIASRGKPVDLSTRVGYYTFDVVAQLGFGGMLGFIEKESDLGSLMSSIHNGFYVMSNVGDLPGQMFFLNNPVSQWLIKNFGTEDMRAFETFNAFLAKRVDERLTNGLPEGARHDMLQSFIEAKDQNGQPLKKENVMMEISHIIGAGADTVSVAILAVLGQILKDRKVNNKLRAEIDNAYADLRLSPGEEIGYQDAAKLPYLTAVVKESMRLHPSIPYQLPRHIPAPGININGHFIPSQVTCGISPAAMNRSVKVFGEDAANFKPERWIPRSDEESELSRLRFMNGNLTTFGMGSRDCVGKNLAIVEVHKFIAQFVRHFDAEIVNPAKPWVTKSQWFAMQKDFWVHLKERKT